MDEAGNALGDLGLSLIKLCKFEDDEGSALGQYTQQGAATRSLASTCKIAGQVIFFECANNLDPSSFLPI